MKIVNGDLGGRIQVNVRNKTRGFLKEKSCSTSMKASIQNLIQNVATIILEEAELEFRDNSKLNYLLPLLA